MKALVLPGNIPKTTPSFSVLNIFNRPGIKVTFSKASNREKTNHFDIISRITPLTVVITNAGMFFMEYLMRDRLPLPSGNQYKVLQKAQPLAVLYLFFLRITHKYQRYLLQSFLKQCLYHVNFVLLSV